MEIGVRAGDLPDAWLSARPAPVVHIAAMPIDAAEAVVDAVRRKSPGALITLERTRTSWRDTDRGPRPGVAGRCFPSQPPELADLVGYDDPLRALGELAAELPTPIIVVKMGAEGVLVWDRQRGLFSAVPAANGKVVDVTGAGDGFLRVASPQASLGDTPVQPRSARVISAAYAVASFGVVGPGDRSVPAQAGARLKAEPPPRILPAPPHDQVSAVPGADRGIASATDIMREEIAMIPELIENQLATLAGPVRELATVLHRAGVTNLFLTGCGDSMFAGVASTLAFRRHSGIHVEAVEAL